MYRTVLKCVLFFLVSGITTHPALAKSNRSRVTAQDSSSEFQSGSWTRGENTMVQLSGQSHHNLGECKVFEINLDRDLSFNFECDGYVQKGFFNLNNAENLTYIKVKNQLTITRYNYLLKKTQTSRLEQSSIKIPYVEEIIHIKYNTNGELAFYLENFELDQFGRIVHKSFIQLHGLKKNEIKVGLKSKTESKVGQTN